MPSPPPAKGRPPGTPVPGDAARPLEWSLFAVAAPGLEGPLSREVAALPGARGVRPGPGGVELRGDSATLYRANLQLRTATRVLVRLGQIHATDFASLRAQAAVLPWERVARRGGVRPVDVDVSVTAHRCRLLHTTAIAERIRGALTDWGCRVESGAAREGAPDAADGAALHLVVRGESDVFTVSADASGERLHRRGFRLVDGGAPLRETLAAGLLSLAGFSDAGDEVLWDPTCGSGTILIEAALRLRRRAPGSLRRFALESWPGFLPAVWARIRAQAQAAEREVPRGLLFGSDADAAVLARAQENAARAGVAELIEFTHAPVEHARAPELGSRRGLILCNPPYGHRIGARETGLHSLYVQLGRLVPRPRQVLPGSASGWRLGILTTEPQLARAARCDAAVFPVDNGGLRAALYLSHEAPPGAAAAPDPSPHPP